MKTWQKWATTLALAAAAAGGYTIYHNGQPVQAPVTVPVVTPTPKVTPVATPVKTEPTYDPTVGTVPTETRS